MKVNLKDIILKNEFITVLKEYNEQYDGGYRLLVLDSDNKFIVDHYLPYAEESIKEWSKCVSVDDCVNYLAALGIVDYEFTNYTDVTVREDLLEDFTDEEIQSMSVKELEEYVYNDDYVNRIGHIYVRLS